MATATDTGADENSLIVLFRSGAAHKVFSFLDFGNLQTLYKTSRTVRQALMRLYASSVTTLLFLQTGIAKHVLSFLSYDDTRRFAVSSRTMHQALLTQQYQCFLHWIRDRDLLLDRDLFPGDEELRHQMIASLLRHTDRVRFLYYWSEEEEDPVIWPGVKTLYEALDTTISNQLWVPFCFDHNWSDSELRRQGLVEGDDYINLAGQGDNHNEYPSNKEQDENNSKRLRRLHCQLSSHRGHATRLYCLEGKNYCCGSCIQKSLMLKLRYHNSHPELIGDGLPDLTLQQADFNDDLDWGVQSEDEFAVQIFYLCPYASEYIVSFVGMLPSTR